MAIELLIAGILILGKLILALCMIKYSEKQKPAKPYHFFNKVKIIAIREYQ